MEKKFQCLQCFEFIYAYEKNRNERRPEWVRFWCPICETSGYVKWDEIKPGPQRIEPGTETEV